MVYSSQSSIPAMGGVPQIQAESLNMHCVGVRGSAGGVAFEGWGGIIKQVCTAVKAWGNLTCVFLLMFEYNWESQRGNI